MHVPAPGETIAVATALQESGLRNLTFGDRDSLGLFQQRPSQGWGTPAQILNPTHAAHSFYTHLLATSGWRGMTTTQAAQAVQHSATPDAYQRWQPLAQALVDHIINTTTACAPTTTSTALAGYHIPAGTPAPIAEVIQFALHQLGKPYRYGATGPNAYDCSGLTQTAYAQIGIHLPRTTQQQAHIGTPVASLADLQPGDLIIQAPHTGANIDINTLTQWRSQITTVRRVA
jgi:cell wall-associated NlpC family hydrolase